MNEKVRQIPPVHELQKHDVFQEAVEQTGDVSIVTNWLRDEVNKLRKQFLNNHGPDVSNKQAIADYLVEQTLHKSQQFTSNRLTRVINGTGTILHTNLGRAKMSEKAVQKVALAARHYSNLEFDITNGKRGSRHDILEDLIVESTGCEAAMVVNNNAAAVYLVLKALAHDQEVVVSRGQLVEIGGSFRVSSIMEESGAQLVEVGTTNKTHPYDYEQAITEKTAMLMKVHTSNFKTIGFTREVSVEELAHIRNKHEQKLILYEDLGSGAIYDFTQHGIGEEPTVSHVLEQGADLVTFSGDKLLGGPQAGIIAGKKQWIDRLKKHQLARVLRVDKMTLAALEETLKAYVKGKEELLNIPTVKQVLESKESIEARAAAFVQKTSFKLWKPYIQEDVSKIGGGTMPEVTIATAVVCIETKPVPAHTVVEKLRTEEDPPIVARVSDEKVVLDFRTLTSEESDTVLEALQMIEKELSRKSG